MTGAGPACVAIGRSVSALPGAASGSADGQSCHGGAAGGPSALPGGIGDPVCPATWWYFWPFGSTQPARARRAVPSVEDQTREHFAFRSSSLLRATRAYHALRGFGALFQSSVGSAETYALSEPVGAIDIFVSHNWGSNRTDKFLTLAMYFNILDALLAAAFGGTAAAILTASGILPTLDIGPESQTELGSIAARLTGFTFLLLALLLAHEVKGRLGCGGLKLFVDKAVIHQTDVELQQEGIRHLAAFLAHTNRMVIVFKPEMYLKRLWTVYELASMLVLKPIHRIVLIPDALPKLVFRTSFLWLLASVMHDLLRSKRVKELLGLHMPRDIDNIIFLSFYFIPIVPIILKMRHWGQQCQWMRNIVKQFRIQSTQCECEEDRPVVFGNIAAFMRDFDLVESGASEAEALDAFNQFVRLKLPMALDTFGGHTPVPYKYSVLMWMGALLKVMDTVSTGFLDGQVRKTCVWAVYDATTALAFLPSMLIFCWWASCEVKLACSTLKLLIFIFSWVPLLIPLLLLASWSLNSDLWLPVFLGMVIVWFAVTTFLYRRRPLVERDSLVQVPRAELRHVMLEQQAPTPAMESNESPIISL